MQCHVGLEIRIRGFGCFIRDKCHRSTRMLVEPPSRGPGAANIGSSCS